VFRCPRNVKKNSHARWGAVGRPAVPCFQARLRSLQGLPHLAALRSASEAERLRHGVDGYSLRGPRAVIMKDGETGTTTVGRWR
jgi:hypothetical protein